ncbi:LLM class flavin-dependent oxidoreductase [Agromyces atrinae]|uniref:Alkanesulfonate monooxygenase SsuD/methylene tetrahydromethanopterin reductase-like flavin-dependent oxidoreductase (Luciferase family) n=1 Tax=Agromyces atrinae TaxID=592376 RepID=A0A4Q2MCI2_9MICO|nr:LLM class flavin-dependent oxidoreductase [Agromyces atrinae]NYD68100.1 alkanesulfonate monooxygenase SsuD/methylene tetrahydromethanopterin reductase-like flavin-dependent oxidoreductase (luciferase family) [Agromyces atrinae]RXZ87752.1 LLM class flavin-dependent oxidoreductase [Agromyces atrinae]
MAIEVGLGVFSGEWHEGTGLDHRQTLVESIEQVRYAEEVGLDSVWVSEHHFHDAHFVGSLAAYCGAMVQATERITVGYGLALAPLHDPIRMAEDAAFLDTLSGGRFVMGIGLGYRDIEFEGFETTSKNRVGRTVELVDICRQAWTGETIEHVGKHFTRTGLRVSPVPVTPGGPPIMMGGHHPNAIDRAARIADRFCMDAGTDSEAYESGEGRNRALVERVAGVTRLYREALRKHGKDDSAPALSLNVGGLLHPDGADAAWDAIADAYLLTRRVYGDWYGLPPESYSSWYPDLLSPDEIAQRRSELLLGSVDDVLPVLLEVREIVGENLHLMFRSKYPIISDEITRQSIDQLAELRTRLVAGA